MAEKTVELKYTLTRENAISAVKLSGEMKGRSNQNRNTTIWLVAVIIIFAFNIISAVTKEKTNMTKGIIITGIVVIGFCLILIGVTWISGRAIIKNSINNAADGTEYRLFINKNGISYTYGNSDEQILERGNFTIKSNDEIYLLTVGKKKLVIPKSSIPVEDKETVMEYLL